MKKTVKILFCVCVALVLLLVVSFCLEYFVFRVPLFDGSGWTTTKAGTVRYLNYYKMPLKQWQEIDGTTYYFDPKTGDMATGWQEIQGNRHYFADDG